MRSSASSYSMRSRRTPSRSTRSARSPRPRTTWMPTTSPSPLRCVQMARLPCLSVWPPNDAARRMRHRLLHRGRLAQADCLSCRRAFLGSRTSTESGLHRRSFTHRGSRAGFPGFGGYRMLAYGSNFPPHTAQLRMAKSFVAFFGAADADLRLCCWFHQAPCFVASCHQE